jgi:hypothetical protein
MLETMGLETKAMINEMEDIFPPVNPGPNDTLEAIMYKAGQRSVVEWIYNKLDEK